MNGFFLFELNNVALSVPVYIHASPAAGIRYNSDFKYTRNYDDYRSAPLMGLDIDIGKQCMGLNLEYNYSRNYVDKWIQSDHYEGPYSLEALNLGLAIWLRARNTYRIGIVPGIGRLWTNHKITHTYNSPYAVGVSNWPVDVFEKNMLCKKISIKAGYNIANNIAVGFRWGYYHTERVKFQIAAICLSYDFSL